jgi:hypothetical protein
MMNREIRLRQAIFAQFMPLAQWAGPDWTPEFARRAHCELREKTA